MKKLGQFKQSIFHFYKQKKVRNPKPTVAETFLSVIKMFKNNSSAFVRSKLIACLNEKTMSI